MPRFSEELINRIKQEVSLIRVAESYGVVLKKHGKDYLGHCPFHDDKTPSFVISPAKNLWNCLGACNCGGSVIDFVMKKESIPFRQAVDKLSQLGLPLVAENTQSVDTASKSNTKLSTSLAACKDDQALLQRVILFYHETLKQSPEALEYLESRGLNDPELIDHFKLGYANRTLGPTLPNKQRKAGAEIRQRLESIGLYRASGHEHFNGSLVIPVMDRSDSHFQITEVYGRKLLDRLRKGTPKHLYLPGPHEGVFNVSSFSCSDQIILCESLIDALTFWRHGFKNVTTSYGVAGFTDEIFDAFKQHQIKRVLIAYDRDEAGNNAANDLAERLMKSEIECFRVLFPKGMDANEYALKMSPARKSLELVIKKAEWMGEGVDPRSVEAPKEPENLPSLVANTELPVISESETKAPVIEAEVSDHEIKIKLGQRLYRIRGLQKNMSYEQMKINLLARCGEATHVDQLDMYNAKARYGFIKQASIELGLEEDVIKRDLGKVLLKLEALQDEQIQNTLEDKAEKNVSLSDEEQDRALELLRDPSLLSRLLADFEACGVVGEETNKLVGYLACVSRKLDKPLAIIIQSTSAAGKSSLMEAVLNLMPEEERIQYSAMTGQSLFYMGETNLKNKILAIAEEEGAEQASYALKLLQSEGQVSIASTGKNETTGMLETKSYTVEGPVMLFLTTTAIDIDEELMNRCLVLTVNETRAQTEAIHALQRKSQTLEGLLQQESKKHLVNLHRNAQRLIRSLKVVNPYAEQLTFLSDKTRTRRDHMKYLQLINSIALLHQYQREVKSISANGETIEYIEVTLQDIEQANKLAHDVLGRSLDELPPQTRKLLQQVHEMVQAACQKEKLDQKDYRFSRKDIRAYSGWSDNQLKVHCHRLEELEYLLVHRGSRGNSIVYELLFDGANHAQKTMMGLLETKTLQKQHYDEQKLGVDNEKLVPSCPQVGVELGQGWTDKTAGKAENTSLNENTEENSLKNAYKGKNNSVVPPNHSHIDKNTHSLAAMGVN
ncbi:MAG: toprim domain-containing protein [Hahellaceae bacterium]|nr:toprim domain-containing protein [Hahellaceae bacterium]